MFFLVLRRWNYAHRKERGRTSGSIKSVHWTMIMLCILHDEKFGEEGDISWLRVFVLLVTRSLQLDYRHVKFATTSQAIVLTEGRLADSITLLDHLDQKHNLLRGVTD